MQNRLHSLTCWVFELIKDGEKGRSILVDYVKKKIIENYPSETSHAKILCTTMFWKCKTSKWYHTAKSKDPGENLIAS